MRVIAIGRCARSKYRYLVLVVARQLGSHTTGYLTWKGGSGSSMETSVVTEYDNSRLQLGLQVGM